MVPAGAFRLFTDHDEGDLGPDNPLVIARLLEDGDHRDLAWLTAALPEERLAGWLECHGGRQLSRRSRAFWEIVLGRRASGPGAGDAGGALWPL